MPSRSIIDIVESYGIALRRSGKESVGLCPFHTEKTPSFTVNEEKGLFHCFGCGAGGDVIRFIELVENVPFKKACEILRIQRSGGSFRRRRPRRASVLLASWLNRQYLLIGARCRDVSADLVIADEIQDRQLSSILEREWAILSDLHDDLMNPAYGADFWALRESIENLTADVDLEPDLKGFLQC